MAPSLIERIHQKIELFRLEQRYTRRRHRRSTFVSNAVYVDGEYVYQTPNSTGSSVGSNTTNASSTASPATGSNNNNTSPPAQADKNRKKVHRFSSMPGFGGSYSPKGPVTTSAAQDWRMSRVSVSEVR